MKHNQQILIVEDHDIVSSALSMIITDHLGDVVIHIVNSFPKALHLMKSGKVLDLIILDVDIPGGESYGMVSTLRDIQPDVRILIFTGQDERKHALRFFGVGANGYVPKAGPKEEIGIAIRTVLGGKRYVSPVVQQMITHSFFEKIDPAKMVAQPLLSPRENEVLDLLLKGKWTKEIASELRLKLTTVSTHKSRIFEKMGVSNVIELFKRLNKE